MPNGKPGDHPITDILTHRHDVYGAEIDGCIRSLSRLMPLSNLHTFFNSLDDRKPEFRAELEAKLEELQNIAEDSGWERDE
ncbi:MAG: hypothetical protein ACI9R3_001964 [Verrucomicrobiales bacterium]|jgi:hypothetical protein